MRRAGLPAQLPPQFVCMAQHPVIASFRAAYVGNSIAMASQKLTACGEELYLLLIAVAATHNAGG